MVNKSAIRQEVYSVIRDAIDTFLPSGTAFTASFPRDGKLPALVFPMTNVTVTPITLTTHNNIAERSITASFEAYASRADGQVKIAQILDAVGRVEEVDLSEHGLIFSGLASSDITPVRVNNDIVYNAGVAITFTHSKHNEA